MNLNSRCLLLTVLTQAVLPTIGVQSSEVSRLLELSDGSISQTGDGVKYFSDIDSEVKNSLHHSIGISTERQKKALLRKTRNTESLSVNFKLSLKKRHRNVINFVKKL